MWHFCLLKALVSGSSKLRHAHSHRFWRLCTQLIELEVDENLDQEQPVDKWRQPAVNRQTAWKSPGLTILFSVYFTFPAYTMTYNTYNADEINYSIETAGFGS